MFRPESPSSLSPKIPAAQPGGQPSGAPASDDALTLPACLTAIGRTTLGEAEARQNALVGLWAGRRMRRQGDALAAYVAAVLATGETTGGLDAIVAKVWADLDAAGATATATEILVEIRKIEERLRSR